MTFYTSQSRYQVETSNEQFQSPTLLKAEAAYQDYVHRKIPCVLYEDGKLQKEYKPHI